MRFECKVRIVKRNPALKSPSYYIKSTITLGKETNTDNDYFLLHFWNMRERGSLKGSQYTKYRLKYNPTKIFTKCLQEGKVTLSFEDPQNDLYIQANVMQLSMFVETLNMCLSGMVGALLLTSTTSEAEDRYHKHVQEQEALFVADRRCSVKVKEKKLHAVNSKSLK